MANELALLGTSLLLLRLLVVAVPLSVGLFLLKRGRFARRIGATPHCPKCDYIILGNQARRPECGTEVSKANIVRGERRRRPIMTLVGVLFLALAVLFCLDEVSVRLRRIDWPSHYPLSWLLPKVDNISSPAWTEIQRRLDHNLLSESDQGDVVERGLQVQNMKSTNLLANNILDYLGNRYVNQKLTPSQADRFFANILKVKLAVRPVIGARSPVTYSFMMVGPGPTKDRWYRLRTLESQVDDEPVVTNVVRTTSGGSGFGLSLDSSPDANCTLVPVAKPGKHRLRFKVEMTTGATGGVSGANWDDKAVVAKRVTQDVFADFEVIEGDTPIATVAAPNAATLRPMLTPKLTYNPDNRPPLNFTLLAQSSQFGKAPLPVDVAFDVSMRINGKEYPMGGLVLHAGRAAGDLGYIGTANFPADLPSNADVILRSSEDVARQTVEIKRIWKGEMVLQNIPIERFHN
jgi:hypothetical protein